MHLPISHQSPPKRRSFCCRCLSFVVASALATLTSGQSTPAPSRSDAATPLSPSVALNDTTRLVFASADRGAELLRNEDSFLRNLSPIDRQLRLQAAEPVTDEQFRDFIGAQTVAWSEEEVERLTRVTQQLKADLSRVKDVWPATVTLIKTNGKEEGGAAYCRADAIVFPQRMLSRSDEAMQHLLLHELFHILSRQSQSRRTKLYNILGFESCSPIDLSPDLSARKLTNPDAPSFNSVLRIQHEGESLTISPVLLTKRSDYDSVEHTSLFRELEFKLLVVEPKRDGWQEKQPTTLLDPQQVPAFLEKIGRNTHYIIHPEEVLADNFVFLVQGATDKPDGWIIEQLGELLLVNE